MTAANAMTSVEFRRCHPKTAKWEGGWSDHAADPGGKTMYGVTEVKFLEWLDKHGRPRRPVRTITMAEAEQLYFEEFWTKAGCEGLFPGVNLATYDAAVNSGVSRGRQWLLASLDKGNDHVKTVKGICARRLSFMQSLNIWKTFGRGWANRVADIEATGVSWAMLAMSDSANAVQVLRDEEKTARDTSNFQTKGAGASGAAGTASGGGLVLDPGAADTAAGLFLGGLIVVGVAVAGILIIRALINRARANAYHAAAASAALMGDA